ncbi:MAG: TonB-dependent receptor [Bacteroidaceae bacterium]|nr:TonB-dependent receptor [Bacteroidaceae bacterium]
MGKKFLSILACLLMTTSMALAQKKVTGTVIDAESGEALIGVAVRVPDTTVGVLTDVNGKFSITLPAGKSNLNFSFMGMKPATLAARDGMKVLMETDTKAMDEVIVVAYGTQKKSTFTGSAQTVGSEDIELRPVTSVTKALEGNVTGVQMTAGSGQPGSSPSIRIRGFGSINASNEPLYVVDGIPYDGALASLNPSDIETLTVLKDASAAALYGARGANGVVMITTKKGKEGKANITLRSSIGWSSRALKRYKNVSQKDYVQLVYEALRNDEWDNGASWDEAGAIARQSLGETLGGEYYNPFKNYTWDTIIDPATGQVRADAQSAWDEDWLDAVTRNNALRHEHQLSLSGGSNRTKYAASLGYLNEKGVLETTAFQRYNARVSVDHKVNDWFSANVGLSVAHSISNFSDYSGTSTSNVWYTAQFINPLFPVYLKDMDGNSIYKDGKIEYDWGEMRDNRDQRPGSMSDHSSLGMLMLDKAESLNDIAGMRSGLVFGSDDEKMGWAQGLKFAVNFGFDYRNLSNMRYMNMEHGNQATAGGLLRKRSTRTQSFTFNQLLTWNRTFDKHSFDVLAGHEYYAYNYRLLEGERSGLVDGIYELRPGASLQGADSYSQDYRIDSWLSRLNYNFDNKYYFSASVRSDASSRFYFKNHRGTFWSVGANWRISKEKFLENVEWLDNLSYKISYGQQGNDNILDSDGNSVYYLWQGLSSVAYPNANSAGALLSTLENTDLTWEKNGNFNTGFEASFLDRRIRVSAEYYRRKTTDMLLNYPMAVSTGFNGYDANVGNMLNQGFEFEITGSPIRTKDFQWDVTWMGSTISNKVTKLTAESPEILTGSYIIKEGLPLNTFYLRKSAGVDPATGKELWWIYDKDEDGNIINERISDDYSKASSCRYEMGSRIPKLYGSLGTDLSWKGLNLSILTTYSIGGKILDGNYYSSMNLTYLSGTWNQNVLRRWQQPGDVTDVPRMAIKGDTYVTDRYLVSASYFAIKNITLSYNLPKKWVNKASLNNVKVYGSCDNVALFSHLDGMDPQYNFSGGTNYSYSPNRTMTFGLEVNF